MVKKKQGNGKNNMEKAKKKKNDNFLKYIYWLSHTKKKSIYVKLLLLNTDNTMNL